MPSLPSDIIDFANIRDNSRALSFRRINAPGCVSPSYIRESWKCFPRNLLPGHVNDVVCGAGPRVCNSSRHSRAYNYRLTMSGLTRRGLVPLPSARLVRPGVHSRVQSTRIDPYRIRSQYPCSYSWFQMGNCGSLPVKRVIRRAISRE